MKKIIKILLFTSILLVFCMASVSAADIESNDAPSDTIHAQDTMQQASMDTSDSKASNTKEITKTYSQTKKEAQQTINVTKDNYNQYFVTNQSGYVKTTDKVKIGDTLNLQGTFNDLVFTSDKENVAITSIGKNAILFDCTVILQGPNNQNSKITNLTINNTKNNCEAIVLNNVENVYVADNTVYVNGSNDFAFTSNTMKNSIVENNYFESTHTQTTMRIYSSDNNQILNNSLSGYANGIYLCSYDDDMSNNNIIKYNTVIGKSPYATCYTIQLMGSGNLVEENTVSGGYRGISSEYSNIIINNDVDAANTGIYTAGNSTIENNYVHVSNNSVGILIMGNKSIVRNNMIECNQTGISINQNDITVTNNTIISKKYGVYSKGSRVDFTGIDIDGNYILGQVYNTGTMTLTSNTIKYSNAKDGGAIYNTGTMTATGNVISANTATANGGAIYNTGTLILNSNNITKNTAASGSAIYMKTGDLTANQNIFINNNPSSFEFKDDKIMLTDKGNFVPKNAQVSIYENSTLVSTVNMVNSVVNFTVPTGKHKYNLIVTDTANSFDRNNFTLDNTNTTPINETKISTTLTVNASNSSVYEGSDVSVTVKLKDADKNVISYQDINLRIGSTTYSRKTNSDGVITIVYTANTTGAITVDAIYDGNVEYENSSATSSFTVIPKVETSIQTSFNRNTIVGNTENITFTLKDKNNNTIANQYINIIIGSTTYDSQTDSNGKITVSHKITSINTTIIAEYAGNEVYKASSTETAFNVSALKTTININKIATITYGEKVTINGTLSDVNGNRLVKTGLLVIINGKNISIKTDVNGVFTVTTSNVVPGTNNVTATYAGNTMFESSTAEATFTVNKKNTKIVINPITSVTYGSTVTINGTFTDTTGYKFANTSIKATLNGKTFDIKTDANGVFTITAKTTAPGVGNVTVFYTGSTYYNACSTSATYRILAKTTKITINPIASVEYGKTVTITGKFTDGDGNIFKNTRIQATLNGKTFDIKTNASGVFTITAKTKEPGVGNVTVFFSGNTYYQATSTKATYKITAKVTKITVNKIASAEYGDTVSITGKFTDGDGNVLKRTGIQATINGKTFTVKTDDNGTFTIASKASTLGTSNVTVFFNGNNYYQASSTKTTFKVTSITTKITINNIGNVKYNTTATITGKFTDKNSNAMKNSALNVVLNGKSFTVKTDTSGSFKITSKANKVGTNNITISYTGSTYYKSCTAKKTYQVIK